MTTFELIEVEEVTGKEFVLCEGTFNECTEHLEIFYGITYYEGVCFNGSKFYIREI